MGWRKGSGVATLAFGDERNFKMKFASEKINSTESILHTPGSLIHLKPPTNEDDNWKHSVAQSKKKPKPNEKI